MKDLFTLKKTLYYDAVKELIDDNKWGPQIELFARKGQSFKLKKVTPEVRKEYNLEDISCNYIYLSKNGSYIYTDELLPKWFSLKAN